MIPSTVIPITIAAFAGYAFAWMDFPAGRFCSLLWSGCWWCAPDDAHPLLRIYNRVGLSGTFLGIWLAHTGYGLPFAVYLLRNFFSSLPKDLLRRPIWTAPSPLTAFTRLALPLSVPSLASLAIFQFIWVWNDLLVALVYLGGTERVAPVTLRLTTLVQSMGQDWHLLTAAAFVSIAVPLLVFFTLQRYFVRGILAGSVKG